MLSIADKPRKTLIKDILNNVDMKMLAQVKCIKNPSEKEIQGAKNRDPYSNFVLCTFPIYEGDKLLGIKNAVSSTMVLPMIRSPPDRVKGKRNLLIHSAVQPLLS